MFERCIYFNSHVLVRKLNTRWDKAFKAHELPPSHGYLIRLVLDQPGLTQQELANELVLDKSTVARFVGKLESDGWLVRNPSETDLRGKVVMPSSKALGLEQKLTALGDELYSTMCDTIGEDRLKTFVATLRDISTEI